MAWVSYGARRGPQGNPTQNTTETTIIDIMFMDGLPQWPFGFRRPENSAKAWGIKGLCWSACNQTNALPLLVLILNSRAANRFKNHVRGAPCADGVFEKNRAAAANHPKYPAHSPARRMCRVFWMARRGRAVFLWCRKGCHPGGPGRAKAQPGAQVAQGGGGGGRVQNSPSQIATARIYRIHVFLPSLPRPSSSP